MSTYFVDDKRLMSKLESWLDNTDEGAMASALNKACGLVEDAAKKNLAQTTDGDGQLARSITSKVYPEEKYGVVGTNLEYAIYVHQGTGLYAENGDGRTWDLPWHYQDAEGNWHSTSGQSPNPFLERALDDNKRAINEIFKKEFKNK